MEDLLFPAQIRSTSNRSLQKRERILQAIEKVMRIKGKKNDPWWQKLLERARKEVQDTKK